ncbi:tetratricopeptide repeat protein [Candidatus Riflebacteria bacterium]
MSTKKVNCKRGGKMRFLSFILISALFLFLPVSQAIAGQGVVTGKYMNVRSEPTTASKILGKVYKNDEFSLLKSTNKTADSRTWHYVKFKETGITGWVAGWLVKLTRGGVAKATKAVKKSSTVVKKTTAKLHKVITAHTKSPAKVTVVAEPAKRAKAAAKTGIAKASKPGKSAEQYFNEGIDYLVKGLYDKALTVNAKAYELKPDDIQIMNNLANSYYRVGKVENAIEIWKKSMKFEENTDVANNLGIVFFNQEKYTEAKTYYKKAISIDEKNSEAYFNLASLYGIMRNYTEAVKNFKMFKSLSKDKELLGEADKRITFCEKQIKSTFTASK